MRVHWVCLSGIIDTCSYNKKSFLSFSLRGYCRSCTPSITFSESYLYNIISNRLTELIQWRCFYPVEEYFAGKNNTQHCYSYHWKAKMMVACSFNSSICFNHSTKPRYYLYLIKKKIMLLSHKFLVFLSLSQSLSPCFKGYIYFA